MVADFSSKLCSCSTFMLYLGIDTMYDLPHLTICFSSDYVETISDIFTRYKLGEDPLFSLQNPSVIDPTLAPFRKSTINVLVPVPNNASGIDWEKEKEAYKEKILDLVIARTPLKDLREHIEVERIITPHDWEEKHNIYYGATLNLAHNLSQMLWFRPGNEFDEVKNCYLACGGTHPGSSLPMIYESGRITANQISGKHGDSYNIPSKLYAQEDAD